MFYLIYLTTYYVILHRHLYKEKVCINNEVLFLDWNMLIHNGIVEYHYRGLQILLLELLIFLQNLVTIYFCLDLYNFKERLLQKLNLLLIDQVDFLLYNQQISRERQDIKINHYRICQLNCLNSLNIQN